MGVGSRSRERHPGYLGSHADHRGLGSEAGPEIDLVEVGLESRTEDVVGGRVAEGREMVVGWDVVAVAGVVGVEERAVRTAIECQH